ncbi:MAG TPA: FtsX-like permease family protein [Micropepsaceae bacterium]|jgi:putative ABC transport system permease protein|nr:FtsX-like permease family protein [Micropepsaceae bacterium]
MRIVQNVTLDIPGLEQPAIGRLVSLPQPGLGHTNVIVLRTGRLPRAASDEVVMSENLALAHHYQPGNTLQATINGRKRTLSIVGIALSPEFIYVLGPGQLVPDDRTFGILWLNRETLEAAYDLKGAFNNVSVATMPNASEAEVISRIDSVLDRYGGTGAYGRADQQSHAFIQQELDQLRTIATILPPIFLGVAAFLINMIMSRLIELEHEQIGLLKAFGYSNGAVGWQYLKFTLAIAVLGIAVGSVAGYILGMRMTRLYAEYYRFPFLYFRTDIAIYLLSIAVALAAAIGGTAAAVMRAVRLAPAVAMVPPPPTTYRQTLIERLGLDRYISEPTHMILRHIERWPLRSFFTVLGIALSGAILIVAFSMFDAIEEMVDSTYFRINRQDATVTFYEPRSLKSIFEVMHFSGVRQAEAIRQVPVRLHNGHISERVLIYGSIPGAHLKRLLDDRDREITVPPQGIVLSAKLAELLNVQRGDRIAIDILEGARRKTEATVADIVSEYIGVSAYMNLDALNRLTGEAAGISGAQVLLDSNQTSAFFAALRRTPATGIVTLRAPAIQAFRNTLARSMLIVISFYVGFGAVIAFGVVYNTARIALSERDREFASLRVLGFTTGEVAYILLGELTLFTLAALPFAALFGYGLSWFMSHAMETKLFRIPFILEPSTYGTAALILLASAAVSLIAVARRVTQLDLLTALKAPE